MSENPSRESIKDRRLTTNQNATEGDKEAQHKSSQPIYENAAMIPSKMSERKVKKTKKKTKSDLKMNKARGVYLNEKKTPFFYS